MTDAPCQPEDWSSRACDDVRAMRFDYLISEIEVEARRLLDGSQTDVLVGLAMIYSRYMSALEIAQEVSREALDKTVIRLKHSLPEGTTIDEVLPDG